MKIELKQLNINMAEQEYAMLQGILNIENGFTNPAYNLSYKEYQKYSASGLVVLSTLPETVAKAATSFILNSSSVTIN